MPDVNAAPVLPTSSVPHISPSSGRTGHVYRCLQDIKECARVRNVTSRLCSSRGPNASLSLLQAGPRGGGHSIITSSGSALLPALSIGANDVVLGLVVGCGRAQSSACGDGSLLATGLALSLLSSSFQLESMHRRLLAEVYSGLLQRSLSILERPSSPCTFTLPSASLDPLRSLARTVLSSKPGCHFWKGDVEHMTSLLLDAHLRSDVGDLQSLQYLTLEGCSVQDSYLLQGILYQTPLIPTTNTKPLIQPKEGRMKVALFNVSLAGDSDERASADVTIKEGLDDVVLPAMRACTAQLVSLGVDIVCCQRVIHPSVTHVLRSHGILVLDRLSIRYIYSMHKLAGGTLLGSFSSAIQESDLGFVSSVEHIVLKNSSYVHLLCHDTTVHTLVLGNRCEQSVAELRRVCESSLCVLRAAGEDGRVLAGAGCWQVCLAHTLMKDMRSDAMRSFRDELGCSSAQLSSAITAFCSAVLHVRPAPPPTTIQHRDQRHHHFWNKDDDVTDDVGFTSCACGAIPYSSSIDMSELIDNIANGYNIQNSTNKDRLPDRETLHVFPQILDSYSISVNAMRLGVEMAVMILGVNNIIQDVN